MGLHGSERAPVVAVARPVRHAVPTQDSGHGQRVNCRRHLPHTPGLPPCRRRARTARTAYRGAFYGAAAVGAAAAGAAAYGAAIPIVAGFCGLRAKGSSEGVGAATTAAVIGSSFAVLIIDFTISAIGLIIWGAGL